MEGSCGAGTPLSGADALLSSPSMIYGVLLAPV